MDKIDSFIKSIAIDENDIFKAKYYIKLRGLNEHIFIKEYIESHDITPSYSMIASIFRYDKRIRRILFKYIGLVEEYLRAYLLKNYDINQDNNAYYKISKLHFSELMRIPEIIDFLIGNSSKMTFNKNKAAIVDLRNKIMHSNLLITNKDLKECKHNDILSSSLLHNIINILYFLPNKDFMNSLIDEINIASKQGVRKKENQVKWNLPNFIIIKIDKNTLNEFEKINRII